jgi:hypothetical protein
VSDFYLHRTTRCPWCERPIDAASATEPEPARRAPVTGDISICLWCAGWLEYTGPGTLKRLSDGKWQTLSLQQQWQLERAREYIWRLRREP